MRGIWIGLALAVAGCGGGAYDWRNVSGGGAGLPEVAMRATGEEVVPPGRGAQKGLAVRTFVAAGEGWNEVTGARCVVTGTGLRADLVTPARLTVPDLGPDAPVLQAECTTATQWGRDAVAPVFGWPTEGRPQPAERAWWGGGWWWGYQRTGPLSYPDIAVGLVTRPAGG
jgi:hypothetical protein